MVTPVFSLSPCIQPPLHLVSMWEPQTRLGQTDSYQRKLDHVSVQIPPVASVTLKTPDPDLEGPVGANPD